MVGLVCRSWLEAVAGPCCWTDIDIEQWCHRSNRPLHLVDSAVRKLVCRSKCTFTRVSAYKFSDSAFSFIANCLLEAIDLILQGAQNLVVPIKSNSTKNCKNLPQLTTVVNFADPRRRDQI